MNFITPTTGYWFLALFAIAMISITYVFARWKGFKSKEGFLLANRQVGWKIGAPSIAASWIWAPALFVSVQLAYEQGLAGIFWFTVPNIIALAIFAFLGPKIKQKFPEGYTLPEYMASTLQSKIVHTIYIFAYFFYQVMAITVQLFAGGTLLSLLTGIPLTTVMPILAVIALTYTYISGLEASIITDFAQMSMIGIIGIIILPMTWMAAGGISSIVAGLEGTMGSASIFDPSIAFSLGIVTAIGLLSGAIADQQYWQRTFAIKKSQLVKSFLIGAVLFGIVPIALSTLGFIAANPALGIELPAGIDASMIGVQTVATLLPSWAVLLFVVMLLCGLSSTLDSGLSAASSLWVTDIRKSISDTSAITDSRIAMLGITVVGLAIAYGVYYIPSFGLFHLWWILNTIAACIVVPTILSLYWDKLTARGVTYGVMSAFIIGLPLFIYGNIIGSPYWTVGATLFIIIISTTWCLVLQKNAV